MKSNTLKLATVEAKNEAISILKSFDIDDKFSVRVKQLVVADIGSYRGLSQFKSMPIFWINQNLAALMSINNIPPNKTVEIIRDTILHEYGHVIWEMARIRSPSLLSDLENLVSGGKEGEEEFAEMFAMTLTRPNRSPGLTIIIHRICKRYMELVKGV